MKTILLTLPAFLGLQLHAQNLITNPSFEQGPDAYAHLTAGSDRIPGWTIVQNGVEAFTATDIGVGFFWPSTIHNGRKAVDLAPVSTPGGGLQQTFGTIPGTTYVVGFWLATEAAWSKVGTGSLSAVVDTQIFDTSVQNFTGEFVWEHREFQFTADDDTATLSFTSSQDPLRHIVALDSVSVLAVPEPTPLLLTAVGGLALAGCLRRTPRVFRE